MENLKFIHNTEIHWIEKTDTKASILLGLKVLILGFFLDKFADLNTESDFVITILCSFLFITLLALFLYLKIIFPQLTINKPKSLIYFKHIAEKDSLDHEKLFNELLNISDATLQKDLTTQIISLSHVASKKYGDLQKMMFLLYIEVLLVLILFIL